MYNPRDFREERVEVLHDWIARLRFASLVTLGPEGLDASHLPMVLDPVTGPLGTLRAHVSRANPQWRELAGGVPALAIFSGPHHYISPSWYPSKHAHGKAVPTWNYEVVHARGTLRAVEDSSWLCHHVEELVTREEARFIEPWKISDAPAEYIEHMLRGIVGVEMSIEQLEGKRKLSQNRSAEDRAGAVAGLRALGAVEMADLMEG